MNELSAQNLRWLKFIIISMFTIKVQWMIKTMSTEAYISYSICLDDYVKGGG